MKTIALFSALFFTFYSTAQLNRKKLVGRFGDSTLTFHQNGKISSIDYTISKDLRRFKTIVYDANGKEIYQGDHGYWHGGKGVYLSYYNVSSG